MGYDSIEIEDKFYVMELMILNNMEKVIKAFLLYLNRYAFSSISDSFRL